MTVGRRGFIAGATAVGATVLAACAGAKKKAPVPGAGDTGATPGASAAPPPSSTTTTTAKPQGPASFIAHGPTTSAGVALTFHTNGDPAITQDLLTQAANLGAKLTFFAVGTWLKANPTMARLILDGGHELGNHTWSHIDLPHLTATAMRGEIEQCAQVLQTQTGSISKWFRPSQTDVPSVAILEQAGAVGYSTSVGYDVDPLDYTNPGSSLVLSRTRARLHGGAVVSLHTLYHGTPSAFGGIVSAIRAKGLEPVTVSTLLGT